MTRVEERREDVITAALGVAQARSWIDSHPEDGTASWSLEAAEDALNATLRRYMETRVGRRPAVSLAPTAPTLREATRAACERERKAQEKAADEARRRLFLDEIRRDADRIAAQAVTPPRFFLYDAEKKSERRPRPYSAVRLCGIPDCYCPGYAHP